LWQHVRVAGRLAQTSSIAALPVAAMADQAARWSSSADADVL